MIFFAFRSWFFFLSCASCCWVLSSVPAGTRVFLCHRDFFCRNNKVEKSSLRLIFLSFEKKEAAAAAASSFSLSQLHRLARSLYYLPSRSLSTARSSMSGALASRAVAAAQRATATPAVASSSSSSHRRRRRQLLRSMPTTRSMLASPRRLAPLSDRTKHPGAVSALPFDDDDGDDDLRPDDELGEKFFETRMFFLFFGADETAPTASRRRFPLSQNSPTFFSFRSNSQQTPLAPPPGAAGAAQEGPSSTMTTRRRGSSPRRTTTTTTRTTSEA